MDLFILIFLLDWFYSHYGVLRTVRVYNGGCFRYLSILMLLNKMFYYCCYDSLYDLDNYIYVLYIISNSPVFISG